MNRLIGLTLTSLFYGALAYFLTGKIVLAIGVLCLFVLALFSLEFLALRKVTQRARREKMCTLFTRSVLLSLLASGSLKEAIESVRLLSDKELLSELDLFPGEDPLKTAERLTSYFEEDHYKLFLSILHLYLEEGGDIALLSESFLLENDEREKDAIRKEGAKKKAFGEFLSLSFVGSLILLSLRFALAGFYEKVSLDAPFQIVSGLYFLFVLLSILLYFVLVYEIHSKDVKMPRLNYEKNKKSPQKQAQ